MGTNTICCRMATACLLLLAVATPPANAQSVTFIKIADAETFIPLTPRLSAFSIPAISNGYVSFQGSADGYQGVFHTNARSFTKLADSDTAIPESSGTFTSLGPPSFSSLYGVFAGTGLEGSGLYLGFGGPLPSKIAAEGDPVPGSGVPLSEFSDPAIDFDFVTGAGLVVAAARDAAFLQGIYSYGFGAASGSTVIADTTTAFPGRPGSTFAFFSDPVVDSGVTVFMGSNFSFSGIYQYTASGGLETVADTSTRIPGDIGTFESFGFFLATKPVATGDGDVVFQGAGGRGQQGIYARIDGRLQVIADVNTAVPGGGSFSLFEFYPPSISSGNVAFHAYDAANQLALYARISGTLLRVVGTGDTLDGKSVLRVETGPQAFDDNFIAFHVTFSDQSQAIYLAGFDIEKPASADINGDGIVDRKDFIAVLRNLGPCPTTDNCTGDMDGNGVVNIRDVLVVLGNRGPVEDGPPANDECYGALDVGSARAVVVPFSTAGATTSEGIALPKGNGATPYASYSRLNCDEGQGLDFHNDIWFRYRPDPDCARITATTCNTADFDTRLAMYTPSRTGPEDCGFLEPLSCNDDTPGCNTTSSASFNERSFENRSFEGPVEEIIPPYSDFLIRLGSRNPDASGSGTLILGCSGDSNNFGGGNEPDSCSELLYYVNSSFYDHFFGYGDLADNTGTFDDTPDCGDDDGLDAWWRFTSPCTGVASAKVRSWTFFDPDTDLLTLAVFNDLGSKMLACGEGTVPEGITRPPSADTYWGAVAGNTYLVRVGAHSLSAQFDEVLVNEPPDTPPVPEGDYLVTVKCEDYGSCGWPFNSTCFSGSEGLPGCNDGTCCSRVCEADPYCCSIEWDDVCAERARGMCDMARPLCSDIVSTESCFAAHGSAGCRLESCCESVCQIDPFCCEGQWGLSCARAAAVVCAPLSCPVSGEQSCFESVPVAGCGDPACCGMVCDADPLCCTRTWDSQCVGLAEVLCR